MYAMYLLYCSDVLQYGLFALPLSGHPTEKLLAQGDLLAALHEFVPFLLSNVNPPDSME